jgi:diguanylate cyclase (GGDEF)-like protein/PAS domain S-box-containing protein
MVGTAVLPLGVAVALLVGVVVCGVAPGLARFKAWRARREAWRMDAERARARANYVDALPGSAFTLARDARGRERVAYVSAGIADLFGVAPGELEYSIEPIRRLVDARDLRRFGRALDPTCAEDPAGSVEYRIAHPVKGKRWIATHYCVTHEADGSLTWHGYSQDITALKRAEQARTYELRTLVDHSPDFIARFDRDGSLVYANPALIAQFDGNDAQALSEALVPVNKGEPSALAMVRATLDTGLAREAEFSYEGQQGQQRWVAVRFVAEHDELGAASTVLAIGRDVTDMVRYRDSVYQLALFDSLTNLPNRTLLMERLQQALATAREAGSQVGFMMLDLDGFKEVNDVLGHDSGDRLLAEVSERFTRSASAEHTVARLGGDEFAIVVPYADEDFDIAFVATKILVALSRPIALERREVFVSASIGIARYPVDGEDAAALLRYADAAMYAAKRLGGNRFCFHDPRAAEAALERLEIATALRSAREQGELVLLFQPIVALPQGRLVGAEALLRWNHPTRGVLSPDQFIAVAEDNGTILDIGEWVFETACACAARWNGPDRPPVRVSVNVSARQFSMNDIVGSIRSALHATRCAPEWLAVEITESLLLEDDVHVRRSLDALRQLGVSIAIDDFGTGYSAMSYLAKFPIGTLKIDRSFVHQIDTDTSRLALVTAMVSMADALSLAVVAEGVERAAQADILSNLGCTMAQGYLYGRPASIGDFDGLVDAAARHEGVVP